MTSPALNWSAMRAAADACAGQWPSGEPGGAILGFDANGLRFAAAGGVESLSTLTPFHPGSVVRFASVTKHVFCAFVLSHPEAIGLDDPLSLHLPELPAAPGAVSVGQALSMTGGLPDTRECLTLHGLSVTSLTDAAPLVDYLAQIPRLNFDAGSELSYSNTGYRLVETALERKGLRFDDFVQQVIGRDLGQPMRAAELWGDPVAGLVPGYWKSAAGWQLGAQGMHLSAAGSLCGSAEGLMHWLQALMAGSGALAGLLDRMEIARPLSDGRATGYGLGICETRIGSHRLIGHGGGQPGFKTYFLIERASGAGVVMVSNREDADSSGIARRVMAAGLDLPLPAQVDPGWAPEGLYVAASGPRWVEVKPRSLVHLDAEDALYPDGAGGVASGSSTSPVALRLRGTALVGEIGHAPVDLRPADPASGPAASSLDGDWEAAEFGAGFQIRDGRIVWGIGPQRSAAPLLPLGGGRWLFTRTDGPWRKRICLNLLAPDRLELAMARARTVEYRRLP